MADEDIPPWLPPWSASTNPELLKYRHTAEALGWLLMRWGLMEFELGSMILTLIDSKLRYEIIGHIDRPVVRPAAAKPPLFAAHRGPARHILAHR